MSTTRAFLILSVALSAMAPLLAADDYRLNLDVPVAIDTAPTPSRVEIYIRGPGEYIDKSATPRSLGRAVSACSLTNDIVIESLISALAAHDYTARITNINRRRGYTYHLLLFEDSDRTVMHYRIFEPADIQTSWCMVDPRNDTGFVYFNDKIGRWLRSHLPTNSLPPVVTTATNKPSK